MEFRLATETELVKEQDPELLIVWPGEEAVSFYERAGFQVDNEIMELRFREYYSSSWARTGEK